MSYRQRPKEPAPPSACPNCGVVSSSGYRLAAGKGLFRYFCEGEPRCLAMWVGGAGNLEGER